MEDLKRQRWYQGLVYSLVMFCIGSFLLVASIQLLNATQTEIDCTTLPKPECPKDKQKPCLKRIPLCPLDAVP